MLEKLGLVALVLVQLLLPANLLGKCPRVPVTVKLLGGNLTIEWSEKDNHVYMTGPATFVFDGIWNE